MMSRKTQMPKLHNCEDFLTQDCAKNKTVQKMAINMHRQDTEYDYLYAHFRALENYRKQKKDEEKKV